MAVEIIGKMKPKNNGTFALVDAADVEMPGGSRLMDAFRQYTGAVNLYAYNLKLATIQNGVVEDWNLRISTIDFIPVGDANTVILSADEGYCFGAEFYRDTSESGYICDLGDISEGIEGGWGIGTKKFQLPTEAKYIRCGARKVDNSAFANTDYMPVHVQLVQSQETTGATGTTTVKTFDLTGLGLPTVPSTGGSVSLETDTTEIVTALQAGAVKFGVTVGAYGVEVPVEVVTTNMGSEGIGGYYCGCTLIVNDVPYLVNFTIADGLIMATLMPLQKKTSVPTTIDMTAFDAEGKIVETYIDGTSKTTTMEFDDDGNPVKITDGDGNVTTLTW